LSRNSFHENITQSLKPGLNFEMRNKLILSILLFFGLLEVHATHIRGGYITAKRIQGYKYEFLLTIFRNTGTQILDETNNLYPDVSIPDVLNSPYFSRVEIPGKQTEILQYKYTYTYKSPGVYTAFHYQLNRNENILNMDMSVQTTFYVETKVVIDPFLDLDQSPVITKAAVDFASVGSIYRYNPGAFDPDGDSLSYLLVPSKQFLIGQGYPAQVTNYKDPAVRGGGFDSSNTIPAWMKLNEKTGELVWNVPRTVGEFNTAIKIIEWRKLRPNRAKRDSIGFVLLDIQIIVKDLNNKPPKLKIPRDTCVVANSPLRNRIYATDPNVNDRINITMFGELDSIQPKSKQASFNMVNNFPQPASGDFEWNTNCTHVRKQPYYVHFQAEDVPANGSSPLVDLQVWTIKVVGPPPVMTSILPVGQGQLQIKWKPYDCANATKMWIYRKIDSTDLQLDTCHPGMPNNNGFVKIGEVPASDTSYLDNNGGIGLKKGPNYCYRIVAVFPDPAGGESLVSNEVCRPLKLDIPVITNVDVIETNTTTGSVLIRWTKPFLIDSAAFPPPYTVQLFRFTGSETPVMVRTTTDVTDTVFVDQNLDTRNKQYHYQLNFRFGSLSGLIDSTPTAQSVRLDLNPGIKRITLQWKANTPWSNDSRFHRIYRQDAGGFVLIDSVSGIGPVYKYVDVGSYENRPLSDTVEYCYFVETVGSYSNPAIRTPLINRSQQICASPTDTIKPCPPPDVVIQDPLNFRCDDCEAQSKVTEFSRTISWKSIARDTCGADVSRYKIYYSPYEEDLLQVLAVTTDTFFVHSSLASLAGCYTVTALDRSGNESNVISKTCIDNCVEFRLPNLITPNDDSMNDRFTPSCYSRAFIQNIHFSVFNRWGKKIFEDDVPPEINWDGLSEGNSVVVVPGVYFYIAEVRAWRLHRKDEKMKFTGWVQIVR